MSLSRFRSLLLNVFFVCILLGFPLYAEGNNCACGCQCGVGCQCGCAKSGQCDCYGSTAGDYQAYDDAAAYNDYYCDDFDPYESNFKSLDVFDSGFECCCLTGTWFPEKTVLFRPFIADPRQVTYSVGWRFNDNAIAKNVIDVSYGDSLAFYRWYNVWPWCGDLQIEIEGALWAVFDPLAESSPLVNADYYVGFPLTYAIKNWAFRLRGYHISSHIGDEFLIDHPGFDRRNPSAEYLDFFVSHQFTRDIRLYGGVGLIVHQDTSFKCSRFYSEGGLELRLKEIGFVDYCNRLYGVPILGMHFRYNSDFKNHLDATYVIGYEFGKLCGLQRRVRFFLEYHDGYSLEGQFCHCATNYLSIRASYGF